MRIKKNESKWTRFCFKRVIEDNIEFKNYEEYYEILYLNQTAAAVLGFNNVTIGAPADACSISLLLHLA